MKRFPGWVFTLKGQIVHLLLELQERAPLTYWFNSHNLPDGTNRRSGGQTGHYQQTLLCPVCF